MIVTKDVEGFQEQNRFFEKRIPNRFARVFAMAQDLKNKTDSELNVAEEKRLEFRRRMLEARMAVNDLRKKSDNVE